MHRAWSSWLALYFLLVTLRVIYCQPRHCTLSSCLSHSLVSVIIVMTAFSLHQPVGQNRGLSAYLPRAEFQAVLVDPTGARVTRASSQKQPQTPYTTTS